jgi:hypothetical protein
MAAQVKVELSPHPDCPTSTVEDLSVEVQREGAGWRCTYIVTGDISRIVTPPPATPGRRDGLWRTTCFEAFVRQTPEDAYAELNFSPSGQWAAYRFDSHRSGMQPLDLPKDPEIAVVERSDRTFSLTADAALPEEFTTGSVRLGLSAVIEERDGTKSYWALAHPPGPPDFHHPDCFAAQLP